MLTAGSATEELVLSGERILLGKVNAATVDGREVGKVLILRDRTELHTILRDRDGALDVTQALRAQAHEFANKLHVISGLLELGEQDKAVQYLGRSHSDAAFVSRPLAAGITDHDVRALLIAKSTVCAERGIEILVSPDSVCTPDGTGDVITVLGNLIDNAVDAAGYDSTVAVRLEETSDGGRTITVEDDGPGVPEPERAAVFEAGLHHQSRRRGSTAAASGWPWSSAWPGAGAAGRRCRTPRWAAPALRWYSGQKRRNYKNNEPHSHPHH